MPSGRSHRRKQRAEQEEKSAATTRPIWSQSVDTGSKRFVIRNKAGGSGCCDFVYWRDHGNSIEKARQAAKKIIAQKEADWEAEHGAQDG